MCFLSISSRFRKQQYNSDWQEGHIYLDIYVILSEYVTLWLRSLWLGGTHNTDTYTETHTHTDTHRHTQTHTHTNTILSHTHTHRHTHTDRQHQTNTLLRHTHSYRSTTADRKDHYTDMKTLINKYPKRQKQDSTHKHKDRGLSQRLIETIETKTERETALRHTSTCPCVKCS